MICTCRVCLHLHAKDHPSEPGRTQTHTVYIRAPLPSLLPKAALSSLCPHPSSKLTLKWWRFIKAAAPRKNSIVITVLREESQIWGFFLLCVDWPREWFKRPGTVVRRWFGCQRSHFIFRDVIHVFFSVIEEVMFRDGPHEEVYFWLPT